MNPARQYVGGVCSNVSRARCICKNDHMQHRHYSLGHASHVLCGDHLNLFGNTRGYLIRNFVCGDHLNLFGNTRGYLIRDFVWQLGIIGEID